MSGGFASLEARRILGTASLEASSLEAFTHFNRDYGTTLCGLTWVAEVMNERPATCPRCTAIHALAGWTFPLPATVALS